MTSTRKVLWSLAFVVTLAACSGGNSLSARQDGSASAESVKIGFLVPQTGVYASTGTDLSRGMELYLKQHDNKLGGRQVDLVTLDEGAGPATATPAARRLIDQEKVVAVTGVVSSASAIAIAPAFQQASIPVVATAQLPITTDNPYWWVDSYPNAATGNSIAEQITEAEQNGKGVYLVAADYQQGHIVLDNLAKVLTSRGVKVAGTLYTPLGTTLDYQPYLSKIKNSEATSIYVFYAGADAVRFVQQYAQFGLTGQKKFFASLAVAEGNLAAQGDSALGIIDTATYSTSIDTPLNTEFVQAYRQAYNAEPTIYSEAQYSAAIVLDKALASLAGKAATGKEIRDAIAGFGTVTTPRGDWAFDAKQGPTQQIFLREVSKKDGKIASTVVKILGRYTTDGRKVS